MIWRSTSFANRVLAGALALLLCCSSMPAQQGDYTFHAETELVLVNVTVRDKSGQFVRGLKQGDFTILEDNKPQKVVSFDVENTDAVAVQDVAQTKPLSGVGRPAAPVPANALATADNAFKDRRLIVLFFD